MLFNFLCYLIYFYLIVTFTSVTILLCFFFLFLIVFKNFFANPDVIENVKPQLAPIITAGAPITLANDAIEILPDNIHKKFNDLSK